MQFWRRNEDLGSLALEYCELNVEVVKFIRACLDYDMFVTADIKVGYFRKFLVNQLQVNRRLLFFSLSANVDYFINYLGGKFFKGVLCTWERLKSNEKKWFKSAEVHWMDVPILHMSRIQKSHFAAIHDVSFSPLSKSKFLCFRK